MSVECGYDFGERGSTGKRLSNNRYKVQLVDAIDIGVGNSLFSVQKGRYDLMQAYCMKCRAKREMRDARAITMKNGRPATQGMCPVCGTKMFRIGKA